MKNGSSAGSYLNTCTVQLFSRASISVDCSIRWRSDSAYLLCLQTVVLQIQRVRGGGRNSQKGATEEKQKVHEAQECIPAIALVKSPVLLAPSDDEKKLCLTEYRSAAVEQECRDPRRLPPKKPMLV